jgi:hypothetical protein
MPITTGHTPFLYCVLTVVFGRSKKQVVGSDTRRIVAVMTNKQTEGDRSIGQCKRESRGEYVSFLNLDVTLPPLIEGATPYPAHVCLLDARPKAFSRMTRTVFAPTLPTTKSTLPSSPLSFIKFAAPVTDTRYQHRKTASEFEMLLTHPDRRRPV